MCCVVCRRRCDDGLCLVSSVEQTLTWSTMRTKTVFSPVTQSTSSSWTRVTMSSKQTDIPVMIVSSQWCYVTATSAWWHRPGIAPAVCVLWMGRNTGFSSGQSHTQALNQKLNFACLGILKSGSQSSHSCQSVPLLAIIKYL